MSDKDAMFVYLLLLLLLLALLGLGLLWFSRHLHRETGLPMGEIVYTDTGAWKKVEAPLISRRHSLVGKPDYLLQVTEKGKQFTIPVEVKSGQRPSTLYENHLLQLGVYCILIEETFHVTPPYGLLHYANATLRIPFDKTLRHQVLQAAQDIRYARQAAQVLRNHQERGRCHTCGYRHACGDQAL